MRDLTILCALILAVSVGAFAGSAAAIHAFKEKDAAEMIVLRGQVEPALLKLFASNNFKAKGELYGHQ